MTTRMPELTTARLRIRPFRMEDLWACHQLLDKEAWQTEVTLEERRAWLQWTVMSYDALASLYQPPYGDRAVVLEATGELVGSVGLVPSLGPFDVLPSYGGDRGARHNRPEVSLFWSTRAAHRRRGFATEAARAVMDFAFGALNLRRIVAMTEDSNAGSQAVMRRLGMKIERNPHPEPAWFQVVGILDNE